MTTTRPELIGDFGMVASTHWLATGAGMRVLERGGNAADAAVAAGFALQVVEPHLNGPGGEVPILVWSDADERVSVVCGQGVSPARASVAALQDLGLDVVPGTGLLAATVPGAFGGWLRLLADWGTWSVRDVLEPAIALAAGGHPVLPAAARTVAAAARRFTDDWPTSAALWMPHGRLPVAGSRLTNPVLAATYRRVIVEAEAAGPDRDAQIEAARRAWYAGFVAEAIGRFCATNEVRDTSGRRHTGLLTADDLARWLPTVEDPVGFEYEGVTVCKTPPWGQGPVMLQQLALLHQAGLADLEPGSAEWIHLIVEVTKLAFADRDAWYGDPRVTDVPLRELLSPAYAKERAGLLTDDASPGLRPGRPGGRVPHLPPYSLVGSGQHPVEAGVGEPTQASGAARGDTCHLDVVDRHGTMISATPSGGWLQSSPAIPELGFCLGTRGQMFALAPDLPDSLRPGVRPRTTLSPSLALRDGRPWLAFGTPGGDCQDQWSLHFLLQLIHGGKDLQQAIDAPAFDTQAIVSSFHPHEVRPRNLRLESSHGDRIVAELAARGHEVEVAPPWSLGRLCAVAREDGWLKAAADPRGAQAYAAGR